MRNVWDTEKRHRNAEEIAERAGQLYEKVVGFATNMDKLGTHLDRAQASFADAKNQFVDGRGSVVRQVEMLKELGAKTNKALPNGWQADSEDFSAQRLIEATPEAEGLKDGAGLERLGERALVEIIEFAADRHAMGEPRDLGARTGKGGR